MTGLVIRRAATVVWPDGTETELRLTEAQRDGRACVRCASLTLHAAPVGHINGAGQVFACTPSCSPDPTGTPGSVETPAREGYHRRPSGPALSSPAPVARSGDSAIKDARGPRDHQRPVSATLSGGPRVLGPGRVGTRIGKGPLCASDRRPPATLSGLLAGWLVDRVVAWFTHSVSFAGPLTAPGATAPASVPEPDPRPALLGHENPPAGGPDRNPQTNDVLIDGSESEPLPPSWTVEYTGPAIDTRLARIGAWDCLFDTVDGHRCLDKYGQSVKSGGSCHASANLMGQKSFARRYPDLHTKAVALRIIEPDPAVA